ncbi:putative glutamine amidotransferase [anaerobic digester metagenome]
MKPLIGITASVTWETDKETFSGYKRNYLSFDYVDAVAAGGGIPVILPVTQEPEVIREMVSRLDGLLLSGGSDISPILLGEEPRERLGMTIMERDRSEWMILTEAKHRKLPILGICRGFQLLNCFYGGSLFQDLSESADFYIQHNFRGLPGVPAHSVILEENSLIRELLGDHNQVNSHHHQALDRIAPNFRVTARAVDGAAEAIESQDPDQFILGVQFHPEMMHKSQPHVMTIFQRFVQEAEKFRVR